MTPEPAAVIAAAITIPDELSELARWCGDKDMPVTAVAATLRHMAAAALGLSSCLRMESRLAAAALTPVTVADKPLPPDAGLVRARLAKAAREVRWSAGHLHDAHRAARAIASHAGGGEGEGEGTGKAPRLARTCSRLVADLEEALADAEHRQPAVTGDIPLIAGHRQVTEALYNCVNHLENACNQVRGPAAAACNAIPQAGRRRDELEGALFHAAVTIQHTRRWPADASAALTDALTARRKQAS